MQRGSCYWSRPCRVRTGHRRGRRTHPSDESKPRDDRQDCHGSHRAPAAPLWGNRSAQHDRSLPLHEQFIANVSWPLGRCEIRAQSPDGRINSRSGLPLFRPNALDPGLCGRLLSSVSLRGCSLWSFVAAGLEDEPSPSCSGHEGLGTVAWPAEGMEAGTVSDCHAKNAALRAHERQSCPPPRKHMGNGQHSPGLGGEP